MSECCLFFYQFLCSQSGIHSIGMAFGRFHASPHGNPFYRINMSPTFCCVSQEFWKNWVKLAWPFMNSLLAWTPAPASQTLTTQELQPVQGEPQISTLWTDFIHLHPISGKHMHIHAFMSCLMPIKWKPDRILQMPLGSFGVPLG